MREHQHLAGGQVLLDVGLVDARLVLVGNEHHDHVGPLRGVGDGQHLEAGRLRLLGRLAAGLQADDDVDAAVLQVQRVGVALRAVADDGDLPLADQLDVRVLVVKHRCHAVFLVAPSDPT